MVCPVPGAIEVVQNAGVWGPVIYKGHCIRCGLCVEICPENVLASGRVRETFCGDTSGWRTTYRIRVDPDLCMKCGNCVVSCPVNKELDREIAAGGHSSNDEVIMRIENGQHRLLHEERTTGCRTCEEACPNGAMRVIRILEGVQGSEECISD
jgi:ferredoxin